MFTYARFKKMVPIARDELSPSDWLKQHFQEATITKFNDEVVFASLPSVFTLKNVGLSLGNIFNSVVRGRNIQAIPLVEVADSKEAVHDRLIDTIVDVAHNNGGEILVYRSKEGQDFNVLDLSKTYRTVHFEEDIHNHSDPRLIDFKVINVANIDDRYYPLVEEQDFENGDHCHLLAR